MVSQILWTSLGPPGHRAPRDGTPADINARFGTGLVVVEQNVPAALKVVDRVVILKYGTIVHDGTAADLAADHDLWKGF